MATTKSTTPRNRSTTSGSAKQAHTPSRSSARSADDSIVAKTGRSMKERPYTSAAIATGAIAAAAAVGAAGAFLYARRDKGFKQASGELGDKVKDGLASATESVKGGIASAAETVKDLGQRGSDYFKSDGSNGEMRSQREIAEEAMSLKEAGASNSLDDLSGTEIKTGAIAY